MGLTTAIVGLIATGGILKSISQVQESEISAIGQDFAAESEQFNADISRQEVRLARARAKIKIERKRKAQERVISEQQVLFAKSGVRVRQDTPLLIMQDTLEETQLDILITQLNVDIESQGLESAARQSELRARQRRFVADQERAAGRLRAGKTLLETATKVALLSSNFSVPERGTSSFTTFKPGVK